VLSNIEIDKRIEHATEVTAFKDELKKCLLERFGYDKERNQKVIGPSGKERRIVTLDIFHNPFYVLATLLDPRIKTVPFGGKEFNIPECFLSSLYREIDNRMNALNSNR